MDDAVRQLDTEKLDVFPEWAQAFLGLSAIILAFHNSVTR